VKSVQQAAMSFVASIMERAYSLHFELERRRDAQHAEMSDALDALMEAAATLASVSVTENIAKKTMRGLYEEDRDITSSTVLAEMAAEELDFSSALESDDHPIWEWALEVFDESDGGDQEEEEEEYE